MCELALQVTVHWIYMVVLPSLSWSWCLISSDDTHSLKQRMLIPVHFTGPTGPHLVFDFSPALQARRVCIRKSSRNFYKKPKFGDLAESLWAHVVCTVVGGAEETSWYCVKKRGSLICFSWIFLAERKLDRKQPLGLFNLHCTITGNRAIIPFYRLNDQLATWLRVEFFPFPHHTID